MRRIVLMALSVVLALVIASPMALGQVGQGAKSSGKAGELAADWWQWALSKPVPENPLIGGDPNYSEEQCDGRPVTDTQGKKWFLAGTLDGSTVERICTMPVGRQLFFPVVNTVFLLTEPDETEEVARDAVNAFIDAVLADPELSVVVTVDGKEIKDKRIVRADSPLFTATVPDGGLLPAGSYDGVADGLWTALPPLSKGEHTIHFELIAPNVDTNPDEPGVQPFKQDNTYHLRVVNGKPR